MKCVVSSRKSQVSMSDVDCVVLGHELMCEWWKTTFLPTWSEHMEWHSCTWGLEEMLMHSSFGHDTPSFVVSSVYLFFLYISSMCRKWSWAVTRLLHLILSTSCVLTHTQLFTSSGIHYLIGIFLFIMKIDMGFLSKQWTYLQQANYAMIYTIQFMIVCMMKPCLLSSLDNISTHEYFNRRT